MLTLILLIIAAASFGLVAFAGIASGKVNLIALGLLAWVCTLLVPKLT